jgi:hypothetical protein
MVGLNWTCVTKWLAWKWTCAIKNHLVAHVVAYTTCCMNMNGWKKQTHCMYIVCTIYHMQLYVAYDLSYATKPIISCM